MFDRIAHRYDLVNTVLSLGTDAGWRRRAARETGLKAGGFALDVACGSGKLTAELARIAGPGGRVLGLDFSPSSGKPVGLDIRQRVLSLPLIYAAEDRQVGPEIRRLLSGSLGDEEVARVAELVTSSDALRRVGDEARSLVEEAVGELERVELNGLRPTLIGLARSAVDRSS